MKDPIVEAMKKCEPTFGGFSDDAKKAMAQSPDYFVWWYTAKSLALVVTVGVLAFVLGTGAKK